MTKKFPINKPVAYIMISFHFGAILALFFFTWSNILLTLGTWFIAGIGIGVGFHRLLTHKGFRTFRWIEYTLALCGCLALQRDMIRWVARHRVHHAFTDKPGDPHSPKDGPIWSHFGWIIYPDPNFESKGYYQKWVPDLLNQKFYRWLMSLAWIPMAIWGVMCYFIGGIPATLWGVCLSVVLMWHSTWLVNSATHMWGSRAFDTHDNSRNSWWVAILTLGEGWHNNHHHNPSSSRHGISSWQIDINWYVIWFLEKLGLVWDIKNNSPVQTIHQ